MDQYRRPLDISRQLLDLIDGWRRFVLALILRADGSTPQKAGVKALIEADGRIWGTLGGGIVEGVAQRRAAEVCQSGLPLVFDYQMTNAYARDAGPICGGAMRILLDPAASKYRSCYAAAAVALKERRRGVLLTLVRDVTPPEISVQWFAREEVPADLDYPGAHAVLDCIDKEVPRLFVEDKNPAAPGTAVEIMVEPVIPRPLLLIAGGGHVGQALARLAAFNDFDVTVLDDRPEFTAPDLFPPSATTFCGDIPGAVAAFPISRDTHIVIVTRGHRQDAEALEACIHTRPAYLGMIGSRRKVALLRQHFIETGRATAEEWGRVFAPIGLDIGAVTVPEIATSIMAQIIAVRRQGAAHSSVALTSAAHSNAGHDSAGGMVPG